MVSVCIPVVSDHGLIQGCLDALAESRPSVDTEVVVVANGLSDDAFSSLQRRGDDIVLVRSGVNAGFSGETISPPGTPVAGICSSSMTTVSSRPATSIDC